MSQLFLSIDQEIFKLVGTLYKYVRCLSDIIYACNNYTPIIVIVLFYYTASYSILRNVIAMNSLC